MDFHPFLKMKCGPICQKMENVAPFLVYLLLLYMFSWWFFSDKLPYVPPRFHPQKKLKKTSPPQSCLQAFRQRPGFPEASCLAHLEPAPQRVIFSPVFRPFFPQQMIETKQSPFQQWIWNPRKMEHHHTSSYIILSNSRWPGGQVWISDGTSDMSSSDEPGVGGPKTSFGKKWQLHANSIAYLMEKMEKICPCV